MNWKGAVKGDLLTGTMIWSKQGQDDIHYTFGNDQIEITDLDGRSFDIEFILEKPKEIGLKAWFKMGT